MEHCYEYYLVENATFFMHLRQCSSGAAIWKGIKLKNIDISPVNYRKRQGDSLPQLCKFHILSANLFINNLIEWVHNQSEVLLTKVLYGKKKSFHKELLLYILNYIYLKIFTG